jgi:DnaK suppressor protein
MRTQQSPRTRSYREFREILEDLREQVLCKVRLTIKEGREEGAIESGEVQDVAEVSEADAQSDLEFTWLQMQGATLDRIAEALECLDDGRYGICAECDGAIPADRLRALPFATRCLECEREHEADGRQRLNASWRSSIRLLGGGGSMGRPHMRA